MAKTAWFCNRNGSVAVLKIDGKKVTKVGEVEVRGLPEGAVFSPDGKYLYVGNFLDSDVSILKVDGTTMTDTGKRLQLPGHPASMRGGADRSLLWRGTGVARRGAANGWQQTAASRWRCVRRTRRPL